MLLLPSCVAVPKATPRTTTAIRLGMTPLELRGLLGSPKTIRRTKVGETPLEVWAYADTSKPPQRAGDVVSRVFSHGISSLDKRTNLFHFANGRLTRWGPANAMPAK